MKKRKEKKKRERLETHLVNDKKKHFLTTINFLD